MTDEMTIQQRKSPLVPTVLGAAAGTGIGYGVGHLMTKPMTHEDIIKDINDTTTFSNRVKEGAPEAATWQEVKNKADEVAGLKEKLDEAKKGVPTDPAIANNLKNAEDAYENEFQRLLKEETKRLGGNSSYDVTFDTSKIKNFDEIGSDKLPTTHAHGKKKGHPFKGQELENLYNNYVNKLKNAESGMNSTLDAQLRTPRNTSISSIKTSMVDAFTDLAGKTDAEVAAYFAEKETVTGNWFTGRTVKPSSQYTRALNIANAYYPEPTTLTPEQFLSIGEECSVTATVPKGHTKEIVKITNDKGRTEYKYVMIEDDAAEKLLNAEKEKVKNLRIQAADEIFAETQKAFAINNDINGLAGKVSKNTNIDICKNTGLYNVTSDTLNMTNIINEGKANTHTFNSGKQTLTGYANDIKRFEEAINKAGKGGTPSMPSNLNGTYSTTDVKEALKQAQARNSVYKDYHKQLKNLNSQLDECYSANPIIREYNEKIAEKIANNQEVQKARALLSEQFPELFGNTTAKPSNISESEIANKAKEYAENKMKGSSFETARQAARDARDAAVKEGKTKVDDAAVKTAQDAFDAGEKSLKEMAESLGKKMTKGPNKLVAAGIGAAVLGLATLLAVNSKNNKAQA